MWLGTNSLPFSCRVLVLMRRVFYSTCERKSSSAGRCRPQPRSISAYEISSSIMNSPKRKKGPAWGHEIVDLEGGGVNRFEVGWGGQFVVGLISPGLELFIQYVIAACI